MIIPILVLFIIIYGLIKKVNIYNEFIDGAKEGVNVGFIIFPYILGMILSINVLIKSNVLSILYKFINPFFLNIKVPVDILPLAILKPISGNASLSVVNDIFSNYGPDSFIGLISSTIQSSTDTTIYILTLYFGSIGINKIRHSLYVGLFADLIGIIASIIFVKLLL